LFRLKSPIKYYLFCKIKNTEFSGTFYFGLSDSSVILYYNCKKKNVVDNKFHFIK
jgi:hypothetical protein